MSTMYQAQSATFEHQVSASCRCVQVCTGEILRVESGIRDDPRFDLVPNTLSLVVRGNLMDRAIRLGDSVDHVSS